MDPYQRQHQHQGFNRFRYKTRVQAVAVVDILVGTIPFINLGFVINDPSHLTDEREYLVLIWMMLMIVYIMQLVMAIWLLAATREGNEDLAEGYCQVWMHTGIFLLAFYIMELMLAISIIMVPPHPSIKRVIFILTGYGAKVVYRASSLMAVSNFMDDLSRPTDTYNNNNVTISQGNLLRYHIPFRYDYPLQPITYPTYPQPKYTNHNNNNYRFNYNYIPPVAHSYSLSNHVPNTHHPPSHPQFHSYTHRHSTRHSSNTNYNNYFTVPYQ